VTGVKDDRFVVRIAENVKVEVSREAISAKLD
jgi:preprotein translocase subunit YajC